MSYLEAKDTINGKEGVVQASINGRVIELAWVKNIEAKMEKIKAEINTLGKRGTQSKTTGWKGTGSMNLHYGFPIFKELLIKYIKTGKDFYFDLVIKNDDPNSESGVQTVKISNCNIDSMILAKIDVESDALDEDIDFTFDDADILKSFSTPRYLK